MASPSTARHENAGLFFWDKLPANLTVSEYLLNGIMVLMVLFAPDQGKPAAKPGRKATGSLSTS
jgi:hypothetical protein